MMKFVRKIESFIKESINIVGDINSSCYFDENDLIHNDHGAARYSLFDDKIFLEYVIHGKIHRTDGPAEFGYYINGQCSHFGWWMNGKRHREDGLAYASYSMDGRMVSSRYYIDDKELTDEQYLAYKRKKIIDEIMKD